MSESFLDEREYFGKTDLFGRPIKEPVDLDQFRELVDFDLFEDDSYTRFDNGERRFGSDIIRGHNESPEEETRDNKMKITEETAKSRLVENKRYIDSRWDAYIRR